jgi:hypothetical protein
MMPSAFDQGESSVYDNNKPPKTVMVGSIMYELIFSQEALDAEAQRVQQSLIGTCIPTTQEIIISPKLAFDAMRAVIIHELLHALFTFSGFSNQCWARRSPESESKSTLWVCSNIHCLLLFETTPSCSNGLDVCRCLAQRKSHNGNP